MKNKETLLKELKKHAANIAKERDAMREIYSDYMDILENIEQASADLENCIEILSRSL